jgi:hypothetical protein
MVWLACTFSCWLFACCGLTGLLVFEVRVNVRRLFRVAWPVGHKPVCTSGCIHRYFAQVSIVCDGGGTECTAVHMELEILSCWCVLKVPLCCAFVHIRVYCWGYAVRMQIGGYCFWCIGYALGNVASSCVLSVRCMTCGKCYTWFCRFHFCHSLGGVVSLSFREVFYYTGASECYSYVSVFE